MSQGRITVDKACSIATVTIANEERLNALSAAMWAELDGCFRTLSEDADLRCIILKGAGDAAFAAGAEISSFERDRRDSESAKRYGKLTHAALTSISDCIHPVIASIKGVCVGGGLEIASRCDMRICGQSARFGIPVKRLGLVVAYDEIAALLRLISPAAALEILLEGRVFTAAEALHKGLVHRCVADNEVETETAATAKRIASGAPLVARWHKKFVARLLKSVPLTPEEADECYTCFDTEDFRAGVEAFLAKQDPVFTGR